jgi:hypothetical protein
MKFSFVELACRIQLDGTKLREIFLLILLVFVFWTISTRSLDSLVEIVETNTRIMRFPAISYPLVVLLMIINKGIGTKKMHPT